ncbi:MAG TPA: cysteine peptidase family C39 domain-containing protein, partial [Vicinamibacterales bacterium]|nr:cysteine peptidase family C39 domain-containing protein [Vicinamibacterales bacterium]
MSHRRSRRRSLTIKFLMLYMSIAGLSLFASQQEQKNSADVQPVVPNRTRPKVTPPNLTVEFGETPSTEELIHARVLPTPLQPVGGEPGTEENRALARALETFAQTRSSAALEGFLNTYRVSVWRPALLINVGRLKWQEGFFSRAAGYWDEAWTLTKDSTDRFVRDLAEVALAEWLTQATTFGQVEALQRRLDELGTRAIGGTAGNKVSEAREGLWQLTHHHEMATFSGPEALKAVLAVAGKDSASARKTIGAYQPPHEGTSLIALQELGRSAGLQLEMRFVTDSTEVPVPSIVHLKSQHYSAVIARRDGAVILRDPALGGEVPMSLAALRDEASGYVLLMPAQVQSVGRAVDAAEGERVFGHCAPGLPGEDHCPCDKGPPGMPTYNLHPSMAAVVITDTPLMYTPPLGSAMPFTLRYNHRTTRLDALPTSSNVGPLWSFDWLSYVQDNNTQLVAPFVWTQVVLQGDGIEKYNSFSGYTHWRSRA